MACWIVITGLFRQCTTIHPASQPARTEAAQLCHDGGITVVCGASVCDGDDDDGQSC